MLREPIESEMGIAYHYPWISMASKYSDVFLKELPGLTLDREIEFGIDLIPQVQPISITFNSM